MQNIYRYEQTVKFDPYKTKVHLNFHVLEKMLFLPCKRRQDSCNLSPVYITGWQVMKFFHYQACALNAQWYTQEYHDLKTFDFSSDNCCGQK